MKFKYGEITNNKTWNFLVPSLVGHGEVFLNKFNNKIRKLAYGIHDLALDGADILDGKKPIFILCDKAILPSSTNEFLNWVREQPYYITDYQADTDFSNSRLHMLVLNVPEEYYKAYDKFVVGLYSEMYTTKQLDRLFKDKDSVSYKVLSKDSQYSEVFLEKVEETFSVSFTDKDKREFLRTAEYEFPYSLDCGEEIFNY